MKTIRKILSTFLAILCCAGVVMGLCSCNGEKENEKSGSQSPFSVIYKGTTIELGKKADEVLEKLGDAQAEDDLGDCGGIGVQIKYTYSDITVNILKEKSGNVIHKIGFRNDIPKTSKGISIGATQQNVIDAYGTPTSNENGKLVYKSNNFKLEFTVKNETVSAINYVRIV